MRVMHPDMTIASYGDSQATDMADLTRWNPTEALALEVERLRSEHRKLSSGGAGKEEDRRAQYLNSQCLFRSKNEQC